MKIKRHWPVPVALLGAVGVIGLLLGSMGMFPGFSVYTNTVTPPNTTPVNSGTLTLALGGTATFSQSVSNMAPGDYVQAPITLTNTGTVGIAVVTLATNVTTVSPSGAPLFTGDSSSAGLQVYAQECSGSWTPANQVYSCSGTVTPILGQSVSLAALTASASTLTPPSGSYGYVPQASGSPEAGEGNTSATTLLAMSSAKNTQGVSEVIGSTGSNTVPDTTHLLITYYLPVQADNTFQGNSGHIQYTFTATQRAGELK